MHSLSRRLTLCSTPSYDARMPGPSVLLLSFHLGRKWFPDHDIHLESLLVTRQKYLLDKLESEFPIDDRIDIVRTLKVAHTSFSVGLNLVSFGHA